MTNKTKKILLGLRKLINLIKTVVRLEKGKFKIKWIEAYLF